MFKNTILSKFIIGGTLAVMAAFGSIAVYNYTTDLGAGVAHTIESGDTSKLDAKPSFDFDLTSSASNSGEYEKRDLASENSGRFDG